MGYFLDPIDAEPEFRVPYLNNVTRSVEPLKPGAPLSPRIGLLVCWQGFRSFDAYERSISAGGARTASIVRDQRRLEQKHGPVSICLNDSDERLPGQILRLKREQMARLGWQGALAQPATDRLFLGMIKRGQLTPASVRAGGTLVAGGFYTRHSGGVIFRTTAFNPEFGEFSPGLIFLRELLKASLEAGDRDFDFLLGRQPYKVSFATHVRTVSDVGREPRLEQWSRRVRSRLRPILEQPVVYSAGKTAEHGFRSLRARARRN
jgi:hypothetical protein